MYSEHPETAGADKAAVNAYRKAAGLKVTGIEAPNPVQKFEHLLLPGAFWFRLFCFCFSVHSSKNY